jgi:hypothetical protein
MNRHPYNDLTFSKPTIKKARPVAPPPAKQQSAQEQAEGNSAWGRRFRKLFKDKDAWYEEYFGKKDK